MQEILHLIIQVVAPVITGLLELIGIVIITVGSIRALVRWFTMGFSLHDPTTKIILGESFALALEFKLGSEIIKTVLVHDIQELIVLGVIVFLRVVMTFVIHWEVEQAGGAHVIEKKKDQDPIL